MYLDPPMQILAGAVSGTGLIIIIAWLLPYLTRRGIGTHPSEKIERRYTRIGWIKAEKKRNRRRYRF